ncbi:MAG: TonB-dependent receptor [Cyclobacteriaceae bacterium]|nr:TonB-dependent receptor [Cyclobacteriaceae bacterium]
MKKSLLIGCFFLLSLASAFSQSVLSGNVYDSLTSESLSGVNIYLPEINIGTSTDENGKFKIEMPPTRSRIRVSHIGFSTFTMVYKGNNDLHIALLPAQNLDEIVIQAFRATELTPVTEKTLQKDQLKPLLVGQDVQFVLEKATPSILSYSESGGGFSNYGQFRLRGIDQSRVNITLNGAPLNDMIDQGVFFSNFTDFTNSIQSVQVQRGVGTSSNGTASYAGSINFESVKLNDEKPSGEIELVGGSFNTYKVRLSAKTGLLPSKTAFFTQFSTFTTDGYRYHTGTDSYSFYGSGGYFGDNDVVKFTAFIGNSQNGLAYSPVAISEIDNDPRTNYLNENDTDNFGQRFVQLQHTHRFSDNANLSSSFYYGGSGGDYFYSYYDENGALNQINYPLQNNHFGITSSFNSNLWVEKLNFTTGIHAYTFRRLNEESLMPDDANPYYVEHSNKDEISLFAKADYLLGKFRIYGDLQFRTLNLTIDPDDTVLPDESNIIKNWTFLNPRLGLTYELDQHKTIVHQLWQYGQRANQSGYFWRVFFDPIQPCERNR